MIYLYLCILYTGGGENYRLILRWTPALNIVIQQEACTDEEVIHTLPETSVLCYEKVCYYLLSS